MTWALETAMAAVVLFFASIGLGFAIGVARHFIFGSHDGEP